MFMGDWGFWKSSQYKQWFYLSLVSTTELKAKQILHRWLLQKPQAPNVNAALLQSTINSEVRDVSLSSFKFLNLCKQIISLKYIYIMSLTFKLSN